MCIKIYIPTVSITIRALYSQMESKRKTLNKHSKKSATTQTLLHTYVQTHYRNHSLPDKAGTTLSSPTAKSATPEGRRRFHAHFS